MFVQITGDEFDAKYELLRCVTEVGVRTYQAQSSDGQIVMVHFLGLGSIEENQDRISQIETLSQPGRDQVVEMIDIDSSILIVTQFLAPFENFDEWLQRESGKPGGAGAKRSTASSSAETVPLQVPVQPSHTSGEPGEFTSLFSPDAASRLNEAVMPPLGDHVGEPQPEEQPPPLSDAPSEPDVGQPGEFTRMFTPDSVAELDGPTTTGADMETEPEPPAQQAGRAGGPAAREPGEFTQIFGSDSTSRPDDATRVPPDTEAEPQGAQPVREEATGEPVAAEPGEFTQMFQPTTDGRTPAGGPGDAAPAGAHLDESPTGDATQPFRPSVETAGAVNGQEPPATDPPPAQQQPPVPRKPVIRWRSDKPTEQVSEEHPQVRWKGPQDSQPRVPPPPQVPTTPTPSPVQPPAPPAGVPPVASAPPPTTEPTQQEPGEFTQLFHDGSAPAQPAASGPPEISGHNTDPRRSLSSMGQEGLGLGGAMPPTADPLKAGQPPGQFTQMFRSGSGLDAPQPEVPPAPQQQPPPEQGKKPGSFTEIFGSTGEPSDYPLPAVKPQSTPQPVQPPPPGGQPPMVGAAPPSAPPVPPPGALPVSPLGGPPAAVPPQVPPPQAQGPGEFTRMVSGPPAAPPQMTPPPPPPGAAPVGAYSGSGAETPKKSQLPLLIVGLSVILVLAVVLILVVVLT